MAGQYGSQSFNIYRKELEKEVNKLRHDKLMMDDPTYADLFNQYEHATSNTDVIKLQKRLKKRLQLSGLDSAKSVGHIQYTKNKANRDKLIISCLPMVVAIARKILNYSKVSVLFDDLVQAGNLGLVIGADHYLNTPFPADARPAKFSSYAYYWCYKYILEESIRSGTILSGGSKKGEYEANKYTTVILQKSERDGDEMPNDSWDNVKSTAHDFSELRIIEDEVKRFRHESEKFFKPLSKNEKKLLFLLYGIDTPSNRIFSQREVATIMGKSPAQISKDVKNIMYKLGRMSKGFVNGEDLIASMCIIHGVDMSQVPEWSMESTIG